MEFKELSSLITKESNIIFNGKLYKQVNRTFRTSPEYLETFRNFLNGCHANISFTIENEKKSRM